MRTRIIWYTLFVFVLSLCASCSKKVSLPSFKTDHEIPENLILQAPLKNNNNGLAYDLHIYFQKRHISGLVFIKKMEDQYRFSMMTKTGQKLLDIGVGGEEPVVHFAMPQLNKKVVLKQLVKDFELLFLTCNAEHAAYELTKDQHYVRQRGCLEKNVFVHFIYSKSSPMPQLVGVGGKRRLKRWAQFNDFRDGIPDRITIDHQSIVNLRLEFYQIDLVD